MLLDRYIAPKIDRLLALFPIVAIIGPRQCGKSTLSRQIRPDWRYYDLENPADYRLVSEDPLAFFQLHPEHLIIDEIQQYPGLFGILRGVIDQGRGIKNRFILTGSASPHLVKGISDSLAGRIATVELAPFKQGERFQRPFTPLYERLIDGTTQAGDLATLAPVVSPLQSMQCWFQGGFPEPVLQTGEHPEFLSLWMENYIANYIDRDVRALFPRLNIHRFRRLLTLLAQFSGHQINMSAIARALEVTVPTVKDYLDIIHQTFIWRNLPPYTGNPLKKVQKADKGWFRDPGLLHHQLKIPSLDALQLHPVAGFSFESFVSEELIRGLQATLATQIDFHYYRTQDRSEVDLVIDGPFGTLPVEIKLASQIRRQSLRGLSRFIQEMRCAYGILVNRGPRIEQLTERIVQIPVHYL